MSNYNKILLLPITAIRSSRRNFKHENLLFHKQNTLVSLHFDNTTNNVASDKKRLQLSV